MIAQRRGKGLLGALLKYQGQPVRILALPRGGVSAVVKVAEAIEALLDPIFARKGGVRFEPELAVDAIVDRAKQIVVRNEDVISPTDIGDEKFQSVCNREITEIERGRTAYIAGRERAPIAGRVAVMIDDSMASGSTIRAALQAIRAHNPRRLVLAVPVRATSTFQDLRDEVDEIICFGDYENFDAIGFYDSDFRQTSDSEVTNLLARHPIGLTHQHEEASS